MTKIDANIVSLINGIISHGNHRHNKYTEQQFADMYAICKTTESDSDFGLDLKLCELYDAIESSDLFDFNVDFDGNGYRIIDDSDIWAIYIEKIRKIVHDCYALKLNQVPDWIALKIDWEQTAKNASVNGYGHTFSGYDGSESEAGGFWIFRTK